MMTKDNALQMCLEYIETDAHERKYVRHAIKAALAQPEHKPMHPELRKMYEDYFDKCFRAMPLPEPVAQNFCPRCGKRTPDLTTIHTCTPPRGLEMA